MSLGDVTLFLFFLYRSLFISLSVSLSISLSLFLSSLSPSIRSISFFSSFFFFLFIFLFIFIYYNFIKRDYVRFFLSSFSFRFRFRFDLIVTFPWFLFALFVRFFLVILVSSVSVGEGSNLFFDQISLPITGLKLVFFQLYFFLSLNIKNFYIYTHMFYYKFFKLFVDISFFTMFVLSSILPSICAKMCVKKNNRYRHEEVI